MSPNFLGEHYQSQCLTCQLKFTSDIEQSNKRSSLICPNCGASTDRQKSKTIGSDSVSIQISPLQINRWDVVAFQLPGDSDKKRISAGIKRVVGLPGETIQIRGGNIYVDQRIARKTLAQQKSIRLPIHDSSYHSKQSRCWDLSETNDWHTGKQLRFSPPEDSQELQWMPFQIQRNYAHAVDSASDSKFPLEDFYGFNQSLNRQLNQMDEIFVELNVSMSERGKFGWRFNHRGTQFQFVLDASTLLALRNNESLTVDRLPPRSIKENNLIIRRIELSTFDRQIQVWIDDVRVFERALSSVENPPQGDLLAIGGASGTISVERVRIWRDLYYFGSGATDSATPTQLSTDSFFLLGDNVPLSIDSRHWAPPGLTRDSIIGTIENP